MSDVELVQITKRFGDVEACAGIDLRMEDGEFVTLLGPSGCGKSTTLNIIAGLESASTGDILMAGRRVNELTPFERDVAMVFQNYALYPQMTVGENIGFSLRLRRRPKAEIHQRVEAVAELLELRPLLDRLPRQLSGGQQQRVALGRAVIREPQVFLFDEPFSNLDATLRIRMRSEIKQLHQRLGITSIFVTHDQEEAMSISDRIAIMRSGKVEQYGTPEEVYSRPCTSYVARFIGSPQTDFLSGSLAFEGDTASYRVGSALFRLPAETVSALSMHGLPVDLGIRAEHVRIEAVGQPAVIAVNQPIGPASYVTVTWDGGALTSRVPGIARLRPGDAVFLELDPVGMMFFDRGTGGRVAPR